MLSMCLTLSESISLIIQLSFIVINPVTSVFLFRILAWHSKGLNDVQKFV